MGSMRAPEQSAKPFVRAKFGFATREKLHGDDRQTGRLDTALYGALSNGPRAETQSPASRKADSFFVEEARLRVCDVNSWHLSPGRCGAGEIMNAPVQHAGESVAIRYRSIDAIQDSGIGA